MSLIVRLTEFKFDDSTPGRFKGYGSTFGNVDLGKDICAKGCFTRTLKDHSSAGTMPAMYWMHNRSEPVGDWLDMSEDSKGLKVEGQLWDDIENGRKAIRMLKGTGPKGLSIGYQTKRASYDDKKGTRTLEDVDLPEVSIVGYGMNPKALVTSIKSLCVDGQMPSIRDLEDFLRDAGMSHTQAKALLADGYKALKRDAPELETEQPEVVESETLREMSRIFKSGLSC